MLRLIGIILDEVIDNDEVILELIRILKKYKRSAKLILYNKNVDDLPRQPKYVNPYPRRSPYEGVPFPKMDPFPKIG